MKRLKINHYILAISVALGFSACTEKVDIDLSDYERKVVVEAEVSTETDSSYVKLTYSNNYFSGGDVEPITNATVKVIKNDHDSEWVLQHVGDGLYEFQAAFRGVRDNMYHLSVTVDGKEYTADSYLQRMNTVLDSFQQTYYEETLFSDPGWAVTYYSNEDRENVGYTLFNCYRNDTFLGDDVFFDSKLTVKYQVRSFELPFYRFQPGDTTDLVFYSLDYAAYNYLYALSNLNIGIPGPFQSPPANPPSNMKGGAIGYFSAFDVTRKRYVVK